MQMNKQLISKNQSIAQNYPIEGIHCSACAGIVRSNLLGLEGVQEAELNPLEHTVWVRFDPQLVNEEQMQASLARLSYRLVLDSKGSQASLDELIHRRSDRLKVKSFTALGLAALLMAISMGGQSVPEISWLIMGLSLGILVGLGSSFYTSAWYKLKVAQFGMDTLVALSTGIAFVYSSLRVLFPDAPFWPPGPPVYFFDSAAFIIAFVLLGKYLEERAKRSSSTAIQDLLSWQNQPVKALRNGQEVEISPEAIQPYERVRVAPQERIPVDGTVIRGESWVDESSISGEAFPVSKGPKDYVYAGTQNQETTLLIRAEKFGQESVLGQIAQAIRQAQASRAPIQEQTDRIAQWFVPGILLLAALTFIVWFVWSGPEHWGLALVAGLSVLIIACPCALGLATPMAISMGIARGAQEGILVRDAASLQAAARIDRIYLDKTGTLTQGKPQVTWVHYLEASFDPLKAYALIQKMEGRVSHPFAQAMINFASEQADLGDSDKEILLDSHEYHAGQGVEANYQTKSYLLGNWTLMERFGVLAPAEEVMESWYRTGDSLIFFACENNLVAVFGLNDSPRAEAKALFEELQAMQIPSRILSGDHLQAVQAIAELLGQKEYEAALSPQDKAARIRQDQSQNLSTAMVGDGINDAEALALADLSIAMGQGADLAIESAGISLLGENLKLIPRSIRLARASLKIIRQNLFWAFIYNLLAIPWAAGVFYPWTGWLIPPLLASAAMALSSLSVIFNSLRLQYISLEAHENSSLG